MKRIIALLLLTSFNANALDYTSLTCGLFIKISEDKAQAYMTGAFMGVYSLIAVSATYDTAAGMNKDKNYLGHVKKTNKMKKIVENMSPINFYYQVKAKCTSSAKMKKTPLVMAMQGVIIDNLPKNK